jgi:muramoyltetrapeptide carboxypeptidase
MSAGSSLLSVPSLLPPLPLTAGARIAVIAPASPFDAAAFEAGVARLRTRYEVTFREDLLTRKGYFAGDEARRLTELRDALADPRVRAIVAARGGYGAAKLLDSLDPKPVREARKLLVGFSDLTALHALWARAGLRSLHASMVCGLGAPSTSEALLGRWIRAVEGAAPDALHELRPLSASRARASAPLAGGNLAVLVSLLGTPYFPPIDGAVLFLEDVGERPYRVDRMLTQLRQAGVLTRISALVLGAFTESSAGKDGTTVDEAIASCVADLDIPVLSGVLAGHLDDNTELPLGARVTVDAASGTLTFDEGLA